MDSIWHLPLCLWHNFHLIKLCSTYVCIFVFLSYACFGRSVSSEVIISIHLTVKQARNHFWTCHQFFKVQYDERCISFQLLQIEFDWRSDKLGYYNKKHFFICLFKQSSLLNITKTMRTLLNTFLPMMNVLPTYMPNTS